MQNKSLQFQHSPRWKVSWLFVVIAILCIPFADLSINTFDPGAELIRFFSGLFNLSFKNINNPIEALLQTIAFAFLGVAFGCVAGFFLALIFHFKFIRIFCALVRSVHELFWALIFLQIFGLHPLTGLLALGLPYAATFAKVFAEIIDESDSRAYDNVRQSSNLISAFFYARLPDLWPHFVSYTSYRLECGLRSSTVLGFVGLPTLGYYLSTAFLEGQYADVWALLILFYVLIASIRYWVRPKLLPFYLFISVFVIHNDSVISFENITRFFTHDIIPSPIRNQESFASLWNWFSNLFLNEALPGIFNTLVLTQLALVLTGIITLLWFPLISKLFFNYFSRSVGHSFLVIMRSTPEYILTFILLTLWGPSMLPAVVALMLHNGAITAHLMGKFSDQIKPRMDKSTGLNFYAYEVVPKIYNQFLAFLFYRWEIIMRETAILGILGITTLGFYIDSAIADIRFDKAMILIAITALLNVGVDSLSRYIRSRLRLKTTVECV
ncbi:ABC transporter, permease protein [hydrothermal vent metagenome]|uniref:ABC transporter, permease protein n=1 Tax=hydrothermal vent metagenome TaxID=652676 RepID=A0A3B0YAN1_9ZZZZ